MENSQECQPIEELQKDSMFKIIQGLLIDLSLPDEDLLLLSSTLKDYSEFYNSISRSNPHLDELQLRELSLHFLKDYLRSL